MTIIKLAVVSYKKISKNLSNQTNQWSKIINSLNPQNHQTNTPHHVDQEKPQGDIELKKQAFLLPLFLQSYRRSN